MPIKRKTHLSQRKNSKRFREKLQLLQSRSTQNSVSEEDQKVSIENTVSVSTSSSLNRRAKGSSSSQEPSLVLENFDDHAFNTVSSATKQSNKKPINCTGIEGQLAANDSENADVLWCKPMPSQSVPREGKVNMALIKVSLSNLHSTSTLSSAEGRPKLITTSDDQMDSCHDCDDTFTVVGMELVTPSTDSSDKILQAPMSCKSKTSTHTIAQRPLVTENRQVSYGHNHDVTKFMNEVKESVAKLLFANWVCAAVDEKILVKLMSPTELSCTQRQISISRNGQVSMIVHGEPLASDHELWSFLPAIPDSCYSVDEFGRYVLSVVRCVTRFDICKGIEDEFYEKHLYILQESSILDENKYKEARYKTTYRAVECLRLITLPRHRCQPCTKVKAMVDKRVKRLMSNVPVHPVSNPPVVTSSKRKRQHCRVKNCKTVRDSLSQTISLFKPVGGRETLEKWVQLTGQKRLIYLPIDSLLKTSLRVCHLHFAAEDLQRTDMTMKLRKNSIPTKFPDGHSPLSENDMKDWRSTNQYKRYWARIESQTPKSREIRTGFPSFQENFTSANDEPSGPFPCLYCETIHTSLNQSCAPTLEGSLESPHLQTQSSVSSFEGTRMAKEEVADILLSL